MTPFALTLDPILLWLKSVSPGMYQIDRHTWIGAGATYCSDEYAVFDRHGRASLSTTAVPANSRHLDTLCRRSAGGACPG